LCTQKQCFQVLGLDFFEERAGSTKANEDRSSVSIGERDQRFCQHFHLGPRHKLQELPPALFE
jgi:hypothetical protein